MALPLVTSQQIIEYLQSKDLGYEIFDEYPADVTRVRTGIYLNHLQTSSRTPYSLAVNYGGNIYIAEDELLLLLVSYQGDVLRDAASLAIQQIVEDNDLLDGYHERNFTQEQEFLNRAEYLSYTFTLSRLEFQ